MDLSLKLALLLFAIIHLQYVPSYLTQINKDKVGTLLHCCLSLLQTLNIVSAGWPMANYVFGFRIPIYMWLPLNPWFSSSGMRDCLLVDKKYQEPVRQPRLQRQDVVTLSAGEGNTLVWVLGTHRDPLRRLVKLIVSILLGSEVKILFIFGKSCSSYFNWGELGRITIT